jgi:hypothetical protein
MECFVVGNFNESINEIECISDFPRVDELGCRVALSHFEKRGAKQTML